MILKKLYKIFINPQKSLDLLKEICYNKYRLFKQNIYLELLDINKWV